MTTSHSSWDDRVLPLWSERVIVAMPAIHALASAEVVHWSELAGEHFLIPQQGAGRELERMLIANLDDYGPQHILRQECGLDRLLGLVAAEHGVIFMLEGATGVRHEGVVYREVHDGDGPIRLNFAAYWRHSNPNPTLVPFVSMLKERYPDLSGASDPD
jgi:DNA-binding transcriptional LysR family regulator